MSDVKRQNVLDDILKQLEEKNINKAQYISLVGDYMRLWDVKESLLKDIEERGVVITYINSSGYDAQKKNDSVAEVVKVNNQMLKILGDLGIRGADVKAVTVEAEL